MKKLLYFGILFSMLFAGLASAATVTIRPDGMGNYNAWANVGYTAATEYMCVNEATANTSDYLQTSSKSISESFTFGDASLSGYTINSVTLYYYAKYYSSTRNKFQPLIRSGSTDYLGTVQTLTSSYATYSQTYNTNPATGSAWTAAEVDALQAGMKSYSANYGGIIAQMYAVVDYTIANSCSDTDGGIYKNVFGTTSGYFSGSPYSHDDYCVDAGNVMEYYCNATLESSTQQSCGTDSYGAAYCYGGDVYKNYTDYSCASGACSSSVTPTLYQDCTAGQYCSGGMCVNNNTCSDTDGGNYPWVLGTVSGYYAGSNYSYSDYCLSSAMVAEYYCNNSINRTIQGVNCGTDSYGAAYCSEGNVYKNYTDYSCSIGACGSSVTPTFWQNCLGYGCTAGVCDLPDDSCTDTDGGFYPYVQGTVSGYYYGYPFSNDDICLNSTYLMEFYCSGTNWYSSNVSCSVFNATGCSSGACY
jgi:hypothetical protein